MPWSRGVVAPKFIVVSVSAGVTTYVGEFDDEATADAHAADHNARPNTSATVVPLVDPSDC